MKKIAILLSAVLLILFSGCTERNADVPEVRGTFTVTALKVGKADAILLETEDKCLLIDCGEEDDGEKIAATLADKEISQLDCVFITHFDKDHVGGFSELSKLVDIKKVISPDYEGSGKAYENYVRALGEISAEKQTAEKDMTMTADDVLIYLSVPKKNNYDGDNDHSLVISVSHGENTFLFAGDAEEVRLSEIMASDIGHNYDFLKVPHHGRFNKMTEKFIETVKPKYAVICDSEKNPAEEETLRALENVGSNIYSTAEGNVVFSSDGYEIKPEN